MTKKTPSTLAHHPNYLAIGIVLGTCFMVAMENPVFCLLGLLIGIALDRLHREE